MPTLGEVSVLFLEDHSDVVIIQAKGRFDQTNLETLSREITPLMEHAPIRYIILDFTKVEFINSKVLGYLAELHTMIHDNKKIVLGGCSEAVYNVLSLVGMHTILHYFENVEEALHVITSDRDQ